MQSQIERIQQRAVRYWYSDGLVELSFGAVNLMVGVLLYAQESQLADSLAYKILGVVWVLVVIGLGLASRRMQDLLKGRVTYTRTGYAATSRQSRWELLLGIMLALLIIALGSGLLVLPDMSLAWMPALGGIVFAIVFLSIAFRVRLARFFLLALGVLLSGGWLAIFKDSNPMGLAYFFILTSFMFIFSGGITLWNYLSKNRARVEATQ